MPTAPGSLQAPRRGPSRVERERERKQDYDARRGSSAARGYGGRWQRTRVGFLAKHPLCVLHAAKGEWVAATVVDHITPHRGDWVLFWDRANWQALCKACHDHKTATEDSGFAGGGASANL